MIKLYRKNFAKFEAKKRAKLGDKAFLEKYIRFFTNMDILMKILLPALLILLSINLAFRIVWLSQSNNTYDFVSMLLDIFMTVLLLFVAIPYYAHHFKFHKIKIAEWKDELNGLNNSQNVENANLPDNT